MPFFCLVNACWANCMLFRFLSIPHTKSASWLIMLLPTPIPQPTSTILGFQINLGYWGCSSIWDTQKSLMYVYIFFWAFQSNIPELINMFKFARYWGLSSACGLVR